MNKETLSTLDKEVPKHKNALEEKYKEHTEKEPRLILIIFWSELSSGQTGLQRSEMEII